MRLFPELSHDRSCEVHETCAWGMAKERKSRRADRTGRSEAAREQKTTPSRPMHEREEEHEQGGERRDGRELGQKAAGERGQSAAQGA